MRLLLLVMFSIPARRPVTPARYTTVLLSIYSKLAASVVLAGNHDWVATLNESRDMMAFLNTTVVASAGHAPQILPRRDGDQGAVLCPIPFLRPRDIITSQAGLNGIEKQQHLLAAITDYYQQHYADACKPRGDQLCPLSPRDI